MTFFLIYKNFFYRGLENKIKKYEKSISTKLESSTYFVYLCIFASLAVKTSVRKVNQTTKT